MQKEVNVSKYRAKFTLSDSQIPDQAQSAGGALPMFHTVPPMGRYVSRIEYPNGSAKKGIVVLDDLAYRQILDDFKVRASKPGFPGLLVDREHLSEMPAGDSAAAAWVKTIELRDNGIWTGWELTDLGQKLTGPKGQYKFRSPVFDLKKIEGIEEWRPTALVSVGLTNVPHFRELEASLNAENQADECEHMNPDGTFVNGFDGCVLHMRECEGHNEESARKICATIARQKAAGKETEMQIVERLRARLAAKDADETQLVGLFDAAMDAAEASATEVGKLKARIAELELKEREAAADAFVEANASRIADKAKVRARYIADPAGTQELVASIKAIETRPFPRAVGRETPAGNPPAGDKAARASEREELVARVRARFKCGAAAAVARAQREHPELWQ
jgi:hypothetical protein